MEKGTRVRLRRATAPGTVVAMSNCCNKVGCTSDPTWRVALVLRPVQGFDGLARARLNVLVCPRHRHEVTVPDLVNDDTWRHIVHQVHECGAHCEPDRRLTAIEFLPLAYVREEAAARRPRCLQPVRTANLTVSHSSRGTGVFTNLASWATSTRG